MIVTGGYVLRAVAGAVGVGAAPSPWLYAVTAAGALFIVIGRRYAEARLAGEEPEAQRATLSHYAPPLGGQLLILSATAALVSYTLYAVEADNLPENNTMLLTVPLVIFGLFRYLYLLNHSRDAESPELLMLRDVPLLMAIAAWMVVAGGVLVLN
jgi:4-hydroxybenzoate polyprenyltransferase